MKSHLILLMLFISFKEGTPRPRRSYGDADQQLHHKIHNAPNSFILRTPQYNTNTTYSMVLLVISAEYEQAERMQIRKLWAAKTESEMQKTGKSLVIFLVGRSSKVEQEAAQFEDLLQVDIKETYRNLVYKIKVGFHWIKDNVQSEYVAKIDSDTVVHIDRLYQRLEAYNMGYSSKDWLACHAVFYGGPVRWEGSAWYVSYNDYSKDYYPTYCNGPGYVMPRSTFEKIVARSSEYKIMEVEDVFFTGVVGGGVGVSFINQGITESQYTEYSSCSSYGPELSILNTHYQLDRWDKSAKNLAAAWNRLKNPKCHGYLTRLIYY